MPASFGWSVNIYTKEVPFSFLFFLPRILSMSGSIHVGSLFTSEDQKSLVRDTFQLCLWYHSDTDRWAQNGSTNGRFSRLSNICSKPDEKSSEKLLSLSLSKNSCTWKFRIYVIQKRTVTFKRCYFKPNVRKLLISFCRILIVIIVFPVCDWMGM